MTTPAQQQLIDKLQGRMEAEDTRRRDPQPAPTRRVPAPVPPEVKGPQGIDLGLVSEEQRQRTRAWVESLPPVMGFLVEAFPATFGTLAGFFAGGGVASLATATAGGFAGEAIAQETGLAPRSSTGLAVTALGPVVGRTAGVALKLGRKTIAGTVALLPPTRVALARKAMRDAAGEFESIATRIIANQQGLMKVSAKTLYDIANKAGVRIPAFRLTTKDAFKPLIKELNQMRALPEVRQAMRLIEDVQKTLSGGSISFAELISAKEMVGTAIRKAKSAAGKKLGAEKQFFKAIISDLDHLAGLGGKTGNVARIAQAASRRAKLDFAIKDLEQGVASFTEFLPGKNTLIIKVKNFRKWFTNTTNPKHKSYNKSMTEALGDEIGAIKENLRVLTKFGDGTPGGIGSLIIRGKGAAVGAGIGGALFGPPGVLIGTLAGAASPEMATAIFSSPAAIKFLQKGAALGTGPISRKIWDIAGQIAVQGLKVKAKSRRDAPPVSPSFSLSAP